MKVHTASEYIADTNKLETEIEILEQLLSDKKLELASVEHQALLVPGSVER